MTRTVVVPFRRQPKTDLDALIAEVAADSRPFAAELLCIRLHQHDSGGCIPAPRGYWPQIVPDEAS